MRYKAQGEWTTIDKQTVHDFYDTKRVVITIESADCLDTRNGHVYQWGARRVLRDGKPIRGKGGTVPFFGELAWCDAERLMHDIEQKVLIEHRAEFESVGR